MESRIDLAKYFKKKGFKIGAEIGVCDGRYSEILCKENPDLKLYSIDPWEPYPGNWRGPDTQNKMYQEAKARLDKYNVEVIKNTSLKASLNVEDKSLDFVFIDGCHSFDMVMLDIILWSRKVKQGGIVSGHDYCHFKNSGVIEAVNKFCEIHRIELNLIGRNQENYKDDRQPCWWFTKK